MKNLLLSAFLAIVAVGCKAGAMDASTGSSNGEPMPLKAGQTINSDLVGTWTQSGTESAKNKTTFDGNGTASYNSNGTFTSSLSKGGYNLDMSGTYALDGNRLTLSYTKIVLDGGGKEKSQMFKLKPMVQQALNKPVTGSITWKGHNAAQVQFGQAVDTLTRTR